MKEGKYQKQKPQIRVNPRNLRHPRSIRLDEYCLLNPNNMQITQPLPYPAVTPAKRKTEKPASAAHFD